MDRYTARITVHGVTQRERNINRLKRELGHKAQDNPSYKSVLLNGEETHLIINTGTQPWYKEFESLLGQSILAGDYIEWENSTWLVYTADIDDELYIDGSLRQCNYRLYWQKKDGTIVSRYAWVQNASAYNNGEDEGKVITLLSNQFMAYLPYDNETMLLSNGRRIHMAKNNNECKPYKLTRVDDITYGYGTKGILNIIFTQTETKIESDRLIKLDDGCNVWICDYIQPTSPPTSSEPDESTDLSVAISGKNELKAGFPRIYSVVFVDADGKMVTDAEFKWNIVSDFDITQTINGNTIELYIDNHNIIGETFTLQVLNMDDTVMAELTITVVDVY